MLLLFILLIALAAFPLILTIWRMINSKKIKRDGIYTDAVIKDIKRFRAPKGGSVDLLIMEYKDRATGIAYKAKATVTPMKHSIGDRMTVAYLPNKPSKYAIDTKGAYWFILIFCIMLFLFVIFAVYKINEMTKTSNIY